MNIRFGKVFRPGGCDNLGACQSLAAQLNQSGTEAKAIRYRVSPSNFATKVITGKHLKREKTALARHQLAYNGDGWAVVDTEDILATRRAVLKDPINLGRYFPQLNKTQKTTVLQLLRELGDDINAQIGSAMKNLLSPYVGVEEYLRTVRNL